MSAPIPLVIIDPSQYAVPQDVVTTQIDAMSDRADYALAQATAAMNGLAAWTPPTEPVPPDLRPPAIVPPDPQDVADPTVQDFGSIGEIVIPPFEDFTGLIDAIDVGDVPVFEPTVGAINMPPAPAPIDTSGAPERPVLNEVALPDAPDMSLPADPVMLTIDLPEAPTIDLPTFDADVPTLDESLPPTLLNWTEPTYQPLVRDELTATIKSMLAGGFAMPQVVQDALFAAARDRGDLLAYKAEQEVIGSYADRGFMAPPGMMQAALQAVRDDNRLKGAALNRDIAAKAAEWAIENLRQAVAQGIALEGAVMQQFSQMATRSLEAARAQLQATIDSVNMRVAVYNASLARVNTLTAIFKTKTEAELSKLEVFRDQIQAEALQGQINEQSVRIYSARVEALQAIVQRYTALLGGVKIQADMEASKIDVYKADVQAWATQLDADKSRFDAYKTQVEGESAKGQMLEAQARAFAAEVQAYGSKVGAQTSTVEAKLRAIGTSVQKFTAELEAARDQVAAQVSVVQSRTQTYEADTRRYAAETDAVSKRAELEVRTSEAAAQNNMAYFEVVSKQFDARMQRVLQEAITMQEILKSLAAMTSQLAAGAMSATHVQASISNSAGTSLSASQSYDVHADVSDV
jgi:hypothetical protein